MPLAMPVMRPRVWSLAHWLISASATDGLPKSKALIVAEKQFWFAARKPGLICAFWRYQRALAVVRMTLVSLGLSNSDAVLLAVLKDDRESPAVSRTCCISTLV